MNARTANPRAHGELLPKEILYARRAVSTLSAISPRLGARLTSFLYFFPKKTRSRIGHLRPAPEIIEVPGRGGRALRFYAWGKGPTVLFVHGWGGCGAQCRSLIEPLLSAGLRLVTFDAPAHGENAEYTTDSFQITECVKRFAEHAGIDAIVAHSFGGMVALRAIHDGVRVSSLVLAAPPNPDLMLDKFAALLRLSPDTVKHHEAYVARRFASAGVNPWVAFSLAGLSAVDAHPLVIHDADDDQVPPDEARGVAEALGAVRHVITKGYGHHRVLAARGTIDATKEFILSNLRPAAAGPAPEASCEV